MGARLQRLVAMLLGIAAARTLAAESVPEPQWRRISLPEVTIITSAAEQPALAHAREFAQYLAALRVFFGDRPVRLTPLTMVIFSDFDRFRDYRLVDQAGRPEKVGGFFLRHESWAVIGMPAGNRDDLRRTLFHEGAHWFMDGAGFSKALWLNEGMAEVLSTFRVDGDTVVWGAVLPDHLRILRLQTFEPLERVLDASHQELAQQEGRTSLFYAESWAFVHMLVFGDSGVPRTGLNAFDRALLAGVNRDAAFATSFGQSYAEMQRQIARYLEAGQYRLTRQPLPPVPTPRAEPAAEIEVDEALGRLALAGGRQALAIEHANAMIRRAPDDARGHTLLAVAAQEAGRTEEAHAEFERAIALGAADFQPYFELGSALQAHAARSGGELSEKDARRAADYFEQAVERYDAFEGCYANLAGVVGLAEPAKAADLEVLRAGSRRFPDNAMISLGLAQCYRRDGDHAAASALIDEVLARGAAVPAKATDFALQLKKAFANQDLVDRVNALMLARKFDEALAFVDERWAALNDPWIRLQLNSWRRDIVVARNVQRLNEATTERRWDDARDLADSILNSDASPAVKANARRALNAIDHR